MEGFSLSVKLQFQFVKHTVISIHRCEINQRDFKFYLSWAEYKKIRPVQKKRETKLSGKWTNMFAHKIKETIETCSFRFTYNHVALKASRKKTFFWVGKASCSFSKCLQLLLHIRREPKKHKRVKVRVSIQNKKLLVKHGRVKHARKISGEERTTLAQEMSTKGISNVYYEKYGNISESALNAGCMDGIGNKARLHKISSEANLSNRLHQNVIVECSILKDVYSEQDKTSKIIKGFVQNISFRPFIIHMYCEEQLRILIRSIKTGSCTLHIDATGKIVENIPDQQKRVYYYTIVLPNPKVGKPPIPVAEMISNSHDTPDLTHFFARVVHSMKQLRSNINMPYQIVIDYSWALLHACLLGFNGETIHTYLTRSWSRVTSSDYQSTQSKTTIHMCSSHLLHSIARKMSELTKDKGLKQFILFCVAGMQRCTQLKSLERIFSNLCIVLLSKTQNGQFRDARNFLRTVIIGEYNEQDYDLDLDTSESEVDDFSLHVSTDALKGNPFFRYFENIKKDLQMNDETGEPNKYYMPSAVNFLLQRYLAIVPLWTCLLFAKPVTNAEVENWMRILKHDILLSKTRLRPGTVIQKIQSNLIGRIREHQDESAEGHKDLSEDEESPDIQNMTDPVFCSEKWERRKSDTNTRKRPSKYSSKPNEIPTPKKKHKIGMDHDLHTKRKDTNKARKKVLQNKSTDHKMEGIPWGGRVSVDGIAVTLSNTCTIDNLLFITWVLIRSEKSINMWMQEKAATIPACRALLKAGEHFTSKQWALGKTVWLKTFNLGEPNENSVWDVWGGESEQFVMHYGFAQETFTESLCSNTRCKRRKRKATAREILLG